SNMTLNSENISFIHWGASWLGLLFGSLFMCSPPLVTSVRAGSVRHIAAFGNAVLEIIPLRLCICPIFASHRLRPVGLDRQRSSLLRKLPADSTLGPLLLR